MILAIETSTPRASLALLDLETSEVVAEREFCSDRAHNAAIFSPLEDLLDGLNSPLTWIVVGTGPGSYSGIRVGIAVANGLAVARGAQAFGWPSLAAVEAGAQDYLVIGDARRKSWFSASVLGGSLNQGPDVLTGEELDAQVREARHNGRMVVTLDEQSPRNLQGVGILTPTASVLARAVASISDAEKARLASLPLEPVYVREPHITSPKPRTGPGRFIHGPDQEADAANGRR